MTGLNLSQVKNLIVIPTLAALPSRWNSPAAVNLLVGTVVAESSATYLHQLGTGPAIGLWEMEPATHDDCWNTFLNSPSQADLAHAVAGLALAGGAFPGATQMAGNLYYACAMARVKYIRSPQALPAANDAAGLARMWKSVYNSSLGAGVIDGAHVLMFQQAIGA